MGFWDENCKGKSPVVNKIGRTAQERQGNVMGG